MKTFSLTTMSVVFLLCLSIGIQAQTTQTKLNNLELFKQFVGTWKGEMGKDTAFVMEIKSFYNGFESYLKTETKGKILIEEKTIMGYDKKIDKLLESGIDNSSPAIILHPFFSNDLFEIIILGLLPKANCRQETI